MFDVKNNLLSSFIKSKKIENETEIKYGLN